MSRVIPGSRLSRFIAAADAVRAWTPKTGEAPTLLREYEQARARLHDAETEETGPVPAVSDEQAQAAIERSDESPPSTRPSVAPGDEERARKADARAKADPDAIAAARAEGFSAAIQATISWAVMRCAPSLSVDALLSDLRRGRVIDPSVKGGGRG